MHHRDGLVLREHRAECSAVADIAANERPPFDEIGVTGRKVIECDRLISGIEKRLAAVRANVARTTGHQHRLAPCHGTSNALCIRDSRDGCQRIAGTGPAALNELVIATTGKPARIGIAPACKCKR
jgi:hypothetical protein